VSIDSLNTELEQLERDVKAMSKDLASDTADRANTMREEAVAAEFIATEEAIENASSLLATLSDLRDVHAEQIRLFVRDQRETLTVASRARSPFDLLQLGLEHWERRATHVASGLTRTVEIVARESRTLSNSVVELWLPFAKLVRGDWARR